MMDCANCNTCAACISPLASGIGLGTLVGHLAGIPAGRAFHAPAAHPVLRHWPFLLLMAGHLLFTQFSAGGLPMRPRGSLGPDNAPHRPPHWPLGGGEAPGLHPPPGKRPAPRGKAGPRPRAHCPAGEGPVAGAQAPPWAGPGPPPPRALAPGVPQTAWGGGDARCFALRWSCAGVPGRRTLQAVVVKYGVVVPSHRQRWGASGRQCFVSSEVPFPFPRSPLSSLVCFRRSPLLLSCSCCRPLIFYSHFPAPQPC